jgi:cytochrome c oxidase subunit 2
MTNVFSTLSRLLEPIKPKIPDSPYFWMPTRSSTVAADTDQLYDLMLWISYISAMGIFAAMFYFSWRYRAGSRKAEKVEPSPAHNTPLEITWSVIPGVLTLVLFAWGFKGYVDLRTAPKDALEIRATGQKWQWAFTYPNGHSDGELHVPGDRRTRIIIESVDVLHSLYIPAFRVKMDAVPGRYTDLWFEPIETGTFPIFCAEYCGTSHSDMLSQVVVHEPGGYEKWLQKVEEEILKMPPVELGQKIYAGKGGCQTCHSIDGSAKTGPSFKGLYGRSESTSAGSVGVDENYLRESLLEPNAKIVSGYTPAMPTFKGRLNDKEIAGLIEYIKSVK